MWLTNWKYRKSFEIYRDSGSVTDYPMKITIGESSGLGTTVACPGCLSTFDDIRFTNSDGETLLPFWIESITGTTSNHIATIWVNFDFIDIIETTFYLYYGNSTASGISSSDGLFILFEDFEWGNDGDDLITSGGSITWNKGQGISKISNSKSYSGTRSAIFTEASTGPSYNFSLTASNNISIQFKVYKETAVTNGPNFGQGDGTKWWNIAVTSTEAVNYWNGSTISTGYSMVADTWQLFEVNNFNWSLGTYDIWLNGTKIKSGTTMANAVAYTNTLMLSNQGTNTSNDVWYDNIIVRKFSYPEPTLNSFGETEVSTFTGTTSWLPNWKYRKQFFVASSAGEVIDYQMQMIVGQSMNTEGYTIHCGEKVNIDFSDLRFTNETGTELLDYWIESTTGTTPNQLVTVWVKFDLIRSTNTEFYLYFGNVLASGISNGYNTFPFFDDFSSGIINTNKWTGDIGSYSISNGILTGSAGKYIFGSTYLSNDICLRLRANIPASNYAGFSLCDSEIVQKIHVTRDGAETNTSWWATTTDNWVHSNKFSNLSIGPGSYHIFDIKRILTNTDTVWGSVDGSTTAQTTTYIPTNPLRVRFLEGISVDWVLLKPRLSTEPTFVLWNDREYYLEGIDMNIKRPLCNYDGVIKELALSDALMVGAGLSAYDIAVKNGFVGTEQEWLASLVGPPGTSSSVGVINLWD